MNQNLKQKIANLLHTSKRIIFLSGAGISVSAGVKTFRGNTAVGSILHVRESDLDALMPTYAHFAITQLIKQGKAKFVVTSNHDNLHRKSGCSDKRLAELFGNAYIEKCLDCGQLYQRHVVCPAIGRICDDESCGGKLIKTGIVVVLAYCRCKVWTSNAGGTFGKSLSCF